MPSVTRRRELGRIQPMQGRIFPSILVILTFGSSLSAAADERPRVCVVGERPSWSYRYLVQALARERDFDSRSLLMEGRAELGAELKNCSVLILVDVSPQSLDRQPELVKQITDFVARGGGLIIAAGDSWRGEKLPFSEILPVQIAEQEVAENDAPALGRARVTGAGLRSPMLRLVDDPMRNQQLWRDELDACFGPPLSVTPGKATTVLAVDPLRRIGEKKIPLIATRSFGEGRVIFLNNGQFWRWRVKPVGNYHGRFWKQLTHFAVGQE